MRKAAGPLRRRKDFDRLFATGRVASGSLFVLRFARSREAAPWAQVGIAVGRRLGPAVVRNRLRRRWREVVRLGPRIAPGWDLVVVVRSRSGEVSWKELRTAWAAAVERNRLAAMGAGRG